jgi:uncharacterized protein
MRFEWDESKNLANQEKHGLSFETASEVFRDPLHVSKLDQVVDYEERWLTTGVISNLVLVVVAHTYLDDEGEEIVRIVSARRASNTERRGYENG